MKTVFNLLIWPFLRLLFGLFVVPTSISSNSTGLSFSEETALQIPGATWFGLEPNTFKDFGAVFATVARTPIVNTRQISRGTITDLDAKADVNIDLTQRNFTRLLQGFFFADIFEKPATQPINGTQVPITTVDITAGNHYNVAANMPIFLVNHLVNAKGFANAGNNGLKLISARTATILTTTTAGEVVEAAPPAAAQLEAVGYQFPAGDLVATIVGSTIVLTSASINMTTLGLNVGEWIFVGGDAVGTQFALNAPFYARILSVSVTQITLDTTFKAVVADAGAAKTIQIFFGKYLCNAVLPANIKRRSYTLERQLGNDGVGIQAEYVLGAIPNDLTINIGLGSKVTIDIGFVGLNVQYNTGTVGLIAGARIAAPGETAFNTSHDFVSTFLGAVDPANFNDAALFGFLSDLKISIKNGITPNKAIGVLGSFEANAGDFDVSGTAVAYFSTTLGASAIRANADCSMTSIFAKSNSGQIFDVPLMGLGGGANKVVKDKPVEVDLTTHAAKCAAGYTMSWTFFEFLPTIAVPA
jgi:hypothetical protein